MAASDISIRFAAEGDSTLRSAVQAIDAQMRALNDQLKASTEGMKNLSTQEEASAKRTEALSGIIEASQSKLKILGEQYAQAKTKLDQLAEAMRKAKESGDPAAIDKATTAYNRQSAEVSKLEGAMARTQGEISKAQSAMQGSAQESDSFKDKLAGLADVAKIQLAQEALGKVVSAMEAVGRAAIDAGKKVWDMAVQSSKFADDLLTQAAQTGISTTALQEYAYAARFVDTEVETITGSLTKLTKSMASQSSETKAAFDRLGVSVTDSSGKMREAEAVFWDAIDALGEVDNATERDQLAMQLFGKSAQQLNPLIKAGSEEWQKYATEAHDAGLILSEEGVSALGTFNDGLQRIDATMEAAQRQIMSALAPAFQVIADAVANAAQQFTTWIQTDEAQAYLAELADLVGRLAGKFLDNLEPAVALVIDVIKSVASAIDFCTENFDGIVTAIQAAVAVFVTFKATIAALSIATLLTNPIGQVIAAVGALSSALVLLVTHWDEVKAAGKQCWEEVKRTWEPSTGYFQQKGDQIYQGLSQKVPNIANLFKIAWDTISTTWGASVNFFVSIWESIKNVFSAVKNVLGGDFQGAWDSIKSIGSQWASYFKGIWDNIKRVFGDVVNFFKTLFSTAWNGVKTVWDAAKSFFSGIVTNITSAFNNLPSKISSIFTTAMNGVKNAWNSVTSWASSIGSKIVSSISSAISSLPSKAAGWARDMMTGFGNSITQFMSKVTSPIKNLARKIKSFLHFSRPDEGPLRDYETWMPDFVAGLASTLTKSQPILDKAVANLAGGIASGAKGITLTAGQTAAQAPIVLQVDGKTFARLVTPYIDTQQGQTWSAKMALGLG
jgi:phage-related protein